ncbi:MAG: NAD(P)/FAD-dependent oxidoreductase [Alphaproteobacteria bacterium]|nr:NAD(P)/FAD-dependent oxidoreductase [Alphaproteobacteria bacterium]
MTKQYDLVVIGTGTAASVAASQCRAAHWRVAVIDHLPFGGTCALRGCDPKKVLVGAAEALDHVKRMRGKGLAGGEPILDWSALVRFKRNFTEPVPPMKEASFAKNGIDAFHGRARFTGPQTVAVEGEELEGRFVLIAAGAVPMRLDIPGEEYLTTSTDFLELDELPDRIALLGGGFIAAEFAHIAARVGARVTILEQTDRMLTQFDPDLVVWLMEKTRQIGVDIRLGRRVEKIEKTGAAFNIHSLGDRAPEVVEADLVVHAAGRMPDLEPLDLAAAGVEASGGRMRLNEFLQSVSNPAIYAAGDAAANGPPLTPVASHDAKVAAANMLNGNHQTPNYLGVPSAVFTIPPLARVGMLESEAHENGLRFRVKHEKTSAWYTARRVGEEASGFKVLIEEDSGRILGAHLLGPHAEEVINLFGMAVRSGLTAETVKGMVSAYPSACSDMGYML